MFKKLLTLTLCCVAFTAMSQTTLNTISFPVYDGKDLGCVYTKEKTTIKVYAPTAQHLKLNLYDAGAKGNKLQELFFTKEDNGIWKIELVGNYENKYYTVQANINNQWGLEVTDLYAKAVGVNGNRVQIIDFAKTNPAQWSKDILPIYTNNNSTQDAVIYELHLRDISTHASSGIVHKGKFLALTELNTKNKFGQSTGLSHIKDLGVTHVHILPSFDFNSVDESKQNVAAYNWGYDPKNYNTPEGSYSTNANDASVRINEFKQMVAALHKAGLRVVMDVVYNHTALSAQSNFHQLVPGYYYRMKADKGFADATGCGNETASEQPMMQKFMIESLEHWVNEYHIDGFRFDLMAVHDIETMNKISSSLQKIKPDILLYGEGWAAGNPSYDGNKLAFKKNVGKLNNIAVFSDDIRDGIKGYVFDKNAKGFVNGNFDMQETIKFGIVGCTQHKQIKMENCFYEKQAYAAFPAQVISYVDCHDNLTLFDKLAASAKNVTPQQRVTMQELAYGLVLTSQGIPFIHAGSEFLRSKKGVENSYNKPDDINAINWNDKQKHFSTFKFIQQLIAIRKAHKLFRLNTTEAIQQQLEFLPTTAGTIALIITTKNNDDSWKKVMVICNASNKASVIETTSNNWQTALVNEGTILKTDEQITISPLGFAVLYVK